jgi:hypothetical protein
MGELACRVRGNRGEAEGFAAVAAVFEEAEEMVVKRAMETAESDGRAILLEFLEPMKDRVHKDEIGIGSIDAGRKDGVEAKMAKPAVAQAAETVSEDPEKESEEMRRGQSGNAMPEDAPVGILFASSK